MKKIVYSSILFALALGSLLLCGGCETFTQSRKRDEMSRHEDMRLIQEEFRKLNGRLEDLRLEVDRLWADLGEDRSRQAQAMRAMKGGLDEQVSAVETKLAAMEAQRVRDRQDMIDKLSQTVTDVVRQATAGRASAGRGSQVGREHTVGPGETLSEIAAAYGVKVKAIIDANQLARPDLLKVGQKLFIPD